MAGVYDSAGNSWAIGPLHAGQSTDLGCLAVATGQEAAHKSGLDIGVGAFAGGIVGAFVVGALGVGLLLWVLGKKNRRGKNKVGNGRERFVGHTDARLQSESQELLHDPYVEPRPASYRGNSGNSSTFNKLVTPYAEAGGYTDTTPVVGYDTPSTLYDPAPSGSSTFPSTPDPNRPFPHPPRTGSYSSPYDPQQPYRENVGLTDFSPSPHFRDGSVDRTTSDGRRESFHTSSSQHGVSGGGIGRGRMGALHAVEGPASPGQRSRRGTQTQEDEEDAERKLRNVYVVHSDGGGDVHIQLPQGGVNVGHLSHHPIQQPLKPTNTYRSLSFHPITDPNLVNTIHLHPNHLHLDPSIRHTHTIEIRVRSQTNSLRHFLDWNHLAVEVQAFQTCRNRKSGREQKRRWLRREER